MIKFLMTQILMGVITIEQVPIRYRAAVESLLNEKNIEG